MKRTLSRRSLLRGMLGGAAVAIALPALEIFLNGNGTAYASGAALPKRFGLFFWGNGILPAKWVPAGTGQSGNWTLSEQLSPLSAVKERVTVVSGTEVKLENVEPHTAGAAGILSGAPLLLQGAHRTFTAPSIDQVVAKAIGGATRFRSLEFGAFPGSGMSYNGPDNVNPPEDSPKALFDRVFGGGFSVGGTGGVVDAALDLRMSALDAVAEDIAELQKRLGANDKQRVDQHLTGIRELERRVMYLIDHPAQGESCAVPAAPLAAFPEINGRPQIAAKNRALVDIVVMALACDQTRVFSDFITHPVNNLLFPNAPAGHHYLTHDEAGEQPNVNAIVKQIVAEFAYLVEALDAVPEGAGTLLDNCVVLGTTDCSYGRTHAMDEFPILLAGSAGGYLKQGYHYRSAAKENSSMVMLTLLHALGIAAGSFGAAAGKATSDLGALVA